MTEQLEQELRHLFAEDAEKAPISATLAQGARRRLRQRQHAHLAWATGALAATVAAVAVVGGGLLGGQPGGNQLATPPIASKGPLSTPSDIAPKGPLNIGSAASCVEEYSPRRVTGRAFAFDGTLTAIGPSRSGRPGAPPLALVAATFTVNEWFRGGSGSTVSVDITPPEAGQSLGEAVPSYGVGSRLLVSGEPRWGGGALTNAIAWGCGFTRYYDQATADSWRAATNLK